MKWCLVVLASAVCAASAPDEPMQAGHRLSLAGDLEGAVQAYIRASAHDKSGDAAVHAALTLKTLGRYDEAIQLLKAVPRSDAWGQRIPSELAWAYLQKGDMSQAARSFDEGLKQGERPVLDDLGMAWVELENRRFVKAQALLEKVIQKRPHMAVAYQLLGEAYIGQDQRENAVKAYDEGLRKDSHAVETRLPLARLHEDERRPDDAWRHYSRLKQVAPFHKATTAGLKRLAALITKKPEELAPPRRIPKHAAIRPSPRRTSDVQLKIGIGTSVQGKPMKSKTVAFRVGAPFVLVDSQSRKVIARGKAEEVWTIRVHSKNPLAEIVHPSGKVSGKFRLAARIRAEKPGHSTTILNSVQFAPGCSWGGMADKELRGELEIVLNVKNRSLKVVNHVPLEEYIYGVLAAEMPSHWPPEALKAQAVISRTLVVYRRNHSRPHRAHGYDLCDEQHCQVYTGLPVENDRVHKAVEETRGRYLTYKGRPAHTVFHSNCGGHTQSGAEIGWGEVPYWRAESDARDPTQGVPSPSALHQSLIDEPPAFCNLSQYVWPAEFRWSRLISAQDLSEKLARKASIGKIKSVVPLQRSASGHVRTLRITGDQGSILLKREHEIRSLMGLGSVRSTKFIVYRLPRNEKDAAFLFIGGGWGHGVGLCQSGAAGRAAAGQGYEEILLRYYEGSSLGKI